MIRFLFATALAASILIAPAVDAATPIGSDKAACIAGEGPAIQANISGLKDRSGRLKLELYPATEDGFLKDDRDLIAEGKTFRRVWAETPANGAITMCIKTPRPGRYALLFTHDRDGRNKFSIWKDGVGIPSNDKLGRSKPKVGEAIVDVGSGVTVTNIRAQYIHGLAGIGGFGFIDKD